MRALVTKSILLLGRYAVLLVAAPPVAVFIVWIALFDMFPRTALVALALLLPITIVAVALPVGLLMPVRRAKAENAVDENAAPGLWAMWNEFDGMTRHARRTLAISGDLNASIGEHRRYFGLVHRHLTMRVGLPLLIVLDERAVRAMIAHEVTHARLQHTSSAVNSTNSLPRSPTCSTTSIPSARSAGGSPILCCTPCSSGSTPNIG